MLNRAAHELQSDKRLLIERKIEKFFSGFLTCWQRKNAFCDSHIRLCYPCVKLRLLLRHGKLPCLVGIHTKNGTYYFYHLRKAGLPHDLAFHVKRATDSQWEAVIKKFSKPVSQKSDDVLGNHDWFNDLQKAHEKLVEG